MSLYERPLITEMLSVQDQLGLTPDQVQRLHALRSWFEKEAIKQRAEIRVAEVDLSDLLAASQPDLPRIEAQVKKIAALGAELQFARIKALEQGRALLNEEQWRKFESLAPTLGPMGPYGERWQQGRYGPGAYGRHGMMEGYGPGGMMGAPGPGTMGSGMMGGLGPGGGYGCGGMMGHGMMGGYGP